MAGTTAAASEAALREADAALGDRAKSADGAAGFGGAWYAALRKPAWTPPAAVFQRVWLTLYPMVAAAGVALWSYTSSPAGLLRWSTSHTQRISPAGEDAAFPAERAAWLYATQWVLNLAWVPVFAHWHRYRLAALIAVFLASTVWHLLLTTVAAGWWWCAALLVPYAVWLLVAAYISVYVAVRN